MDYIVASLTAGLSHERKCKENSMDTTATVRALILEEKKRDIENDLDAYRSWRDQMQEYAEQETDPDKISNWLLRVAKMDDEIDALLLQKDNLSTVLKKEIPMRTIPPATRPQLMSLLAFIMKKCGTQPAGKKAIAALDNAIDCLDELESDDAFDWRFDAEAEARDYADLKATQEDALQIGLQ